MEANQEKVNIKLGSKRKASIDEEREVKRKIPRSSDQTSDDDNELGLNARDGTAETDLSSTENKTQNSNQSYALNLSIITSESIKFESTAKKIEDDDKIGDNDRSRNDEESQECGLLYSTIPKESNTDSNQDESSNKKTEVKEQVGKDKEETKGTSHVGHSSLKVGKPTPEAINSIDKNISDAKKDTEEDKLEIGPGGSNENSEDGADSDKEVAVEDKRDEYIYRILRFNEIYQNGLRPKNINSRMSIQQHVEKGSRRQESRYIEIMDATTEYEMTRPVSLGLRPIRRRDNEKRGTKTKLRRRLVHRRYFLRSKVHHEKLNKELKVHVTDISQYLIRNNDESLKSNFSHSSSTSKKETATGISKDKTYSIKKPIEKEHPIRERDWSIFSIFGNAEKVDKDESQAIYTDVGNRKENSNALDEQEFQGIKNDEANSVEHSVTSEPVINEEKGTGQEPDEYIYRILRFNESYDGGLRPKNIFSRVSLQEHVERGSRGQESRFISCCKTIYGIEELGSLTNEFQRIREVVRINITKLKDRARVIDLTKEEIRERHISRGSHAWGYAERFEEVTIDPASHVPSECVEKIGVVHSFI